MTKVKEAMSLDERRSRVADKVRDQFGAGEEYGPWIEDLFDSYAICREEDADYFRVDYTIDAEGNVTLGQKVAVRKEFIPISIQASLREASDGDGRIFDVTIIEAGFSLNRDINPDTGTSHRRYYPPEILSSEDVIGIFEGAEVRMIRLGASIEDDLDHTPEGIPKELLSGNIVGVLENVHYGQGALRGRLVLHEGATFSAGLLRLSVEREPPMLGLSIDAKGHIEFTSHEGEEVAAVTALHGPASVDVVSRPAAGGGLIRLAASLQKEHTMPDPKKEPQGGDKPAAAVKDPPVKPIEAKPVDMDALKESIAEKVRKDIEAKLAEERKEQEKQAATIRESDQSLETKLKESNLPDEGVELVREKFAGATWEDTTVDGYIGKVRKLIPDDTGRVVVPGRLFEGGADVRDKVVRAELYDLFMQNSVEETRNAARKELKEAGGTPIYSLHKLLREAFGVDILDLDRSSGKERKRLTESLVTGTWTDIFGDVMNKTLLDAYHANPWTDWRKIVRIKPLKDFMTQHAIRMGGYGNLDTVAEGANYTAATSPGDEEHEWTPTKRGNTEDLTREMLLADDVMAIGRIPVGLAYAAARTVYEFVFDQITIAGQPTMDYDATALFATSRTYNDNLGTTALAAAEVAVVWLAMQQFTDMTSAKREAIHPKYLCVPVNLAATAFGIVKPLSEFAPGETTDTAFVRTMGLEVIVVQHWTNAKDHVYVADPALVPGFLMGFVGGQEDPRIFVQDNENFGSVFDRDAITYKIRHEYGGSPVDHRAFYAEDVA